MSISEEKPMKKEKVISYDVEKMPDPKKMTKRYKKYEEKSKRSSKKGEKK